MSPSINAFLTSELDKPQYPLLFARYFLNREDYVQRKEALLFFERSLSKNISYYNIQNLQEIAEVLEAITLNIINQEGTPCQIILELLNLLPKSIVMLFSIVGVQWESFFKIITLYEQNIMYFDFCANLMSELLDIRSDQSTEIVHQFGAKLIHFGITSEKIEYFFPSYKILLKSPIFSELGECYQKIYQVAKDSFTIFKDLPNFLCQFWARLSNFHISSETDREFSLVAMEFLRVMNSSISDESIPIEYDSDIAEVFVYFLCNRVDVLVEEAEIQLLLKSYVKLIKQLLITSTSSSIIKDSISVLMKLFYYNCTPEQLKYSVQFFMYKINKYLFPESKILNTEGNGEENAAGSAVVTPIGNGNIENAFFKISDESNNENIHLLVASYLFVDIISYHPKAALPYISSHYIPLIEKLISHALEVYDVFTCFISSSICNEINYYNFFEKVLNHLFNDKYEIRLGCYDVIISFGTVMNYLSGFIFPILIQNINEDRPNEFHWYLDCLYSTFNPSLTFSDENSSKLYVLFESLLQNPDENIKLKAALFVFKLMIMHSHIFSPMFQVALDILIQNPEEDNTYYAFSKYIQYFGLKNIEEYFHDLFSAANNYLDNEDKFMCAAALLKYVPETRKTKEAQQFYQSIVYDSEMNLGELSNLDSLSHLIFIEEYFVIFFADIHKKIRVLNNVRKDLLLGYCKISRKMLKNIPSNIKDLENIARVVDTSFSNFLAKNIESAVQSNPNANPEEGIGLLVQDMTFITHNAAILAEFGIMLATLSIDKVRIVTQMFLNLSASGDYEVLYSAMVFFEKALKFGVVSEDEMGELIKFSVAALEGIRVDVHLNQFFNVVSVMPPEVVSNLWGNLIEFFVAVQPSSRDFQCSFSLLSAIFINYMGKNPEIFNPQIASECLDHFPPFQRNKTMMFLEGIISIATNDFPDEIKTKANGCLMEYLSWNQNRTKFYKVSEEMDSFIVSNFATQQ